MRGTSTSTFWSSNLLGAEYSYMRNHVCFDGSRQGGDKWMLGKAICESYGGQIASILHNDITTAIWDYYSEANVIQHNFWLGLNDKASDGIYIWENGDTYQWDNFQNSNDATNGDCVIIFQGSKQWNTVPCDEAIRSILCMKGTSSVADATCRIANRQSSKSFANGCTFSSGSSSSSGGGYDELACCMKCQGFSGIGGVTVKSNGKGCWCEDTSRSGCSSPYSAGGYNTADCTCASKRKRRSTFNDSDIDNLLDMNTEAAETSPIKLSTKEANSYTRNLRSSHHDPNHHQRYVRQAVDPTKQRQISCEWGWNSGASVAGGYWSYEHQVPEYCFSEFGLSIISDLH